MLKGSLSLVGCGIKFMSHLTLESKAFIEKADKILFLVNEPAMKAWLLTHPREAVSLEDIYSHHKLRRDVYREITKTILDSLKEGQHICVVVEGHPTVYARPFIPAITEAKKRGYETYVLPAISADAFLFAELLIDPGNVGCQSYEATDFLIHKRSFDGFSHLLLWQISVVGLLNSSQHYDNKSALTVLVNYLTKCYDPSHEVILYEGSQYSYISSKITKLPLAKLPETFISRISTLYIPPNKKAEYDIEMIDALNINLENLRV